MSRSFYTSSATPPPAATVVASTNPLPIDSSRSSNLRVQTEVIPRRASQNQSATNHREINMTTSPDSMPHYIINREPGSDGQVPMLRLPRIMQEDQSNRYTIPTKSQGVRGYTNTNTNTSTNNSNNNTKDQSIPSKISTSHNNSTTPNSQVTGYPSKSTIVRQPGGSNTATGSTGASAADNEHMNQLLEILGDPQNERLELQTNSKLPYYFAQRTRRSQTNQSSHTLDPNSYKYQQNHQSSFQLPQQQQIQQTPSNNLLQQHLIPKRTGQTPSQLGLQYNIPQKSNYNNNNDTPQSLQLDASADLIRKRQLRRNPNIPLKQQPQSSMPQDTLDDEVVYTKTIDSTRNNINTQIPLIQPSHTPNSAQPSYPTSAIRSSSSQPFENQQQHSQYPHQMSPGMDFKQQTPTMTTPDERNANSYSGAKSTLSSTATKRNQIGSRDRIPSISDQKRQTAAAGWGVLKELKQMEDDFASEERDHKTLIDAISENRLTEAADTTAYRLLEYFSKNRQLQQPTSQNKATGTKNMAATTTTVSGLASAQRGGLNSKFAARRKIPTATTNILQPRVNEFQFSPETPISDQIEINGILKNLNCYSKAISKY